MRFSKPCCLLLEKGRLSGSAHTRRSRANDTPTNQMMIAAAQSHLRKLKHIQHASAGGVFGEILHAAHKAQRSRFIARIKPARHNGSCPAPYTGENCDILLSVGSFISNRLADNSRSSFEP